MFPKNRKNATLAARVLLLTGVGAAALVHNLEGMPATSPPAALGQNGRPDAASYAAASAGGGAGYYPSIPPPAYVSQPQPVQAQIAGNQNSNVQYAEGQYANGSRMTWRAHRARHRGRSKKHSIEIVAGAAATGAAIGAIAGGGPGAAIGAISGAGAGFVYDRLTHNH